MKKVIIKFLIFLKNAGKIQKNIKKYDEAIFWYEKLSELSTSKYYDEAVTEGLARCAAMVNNFEKAREYFEPIANTPKEEKDYKYMISDIHAARNFLAKMK